MRAAICFIAFSLALLQLCNSQGEQSEKRLPQRTSPGQEEDPPADADGGSGPPGGSPGGTQRHLAAGAHSQPQALSCKEHLGWRPPLNQICPTRPRDCEKVSCWRYITVGYLCGLPLELAKPIWLKGTLCKYENAPCSYPRTYNCKCTTKVCWIKLRRWICIPQKRTNKTIYILVTLYWRRPCGCDCRGHRVFTTHWSPPGGADIISPNDY